MTEELEVKGGKTVRKLQVNEVVEALEEGKKADSLGLARVRVKAESDGKEGWVTLAGNQGTMYLDTYSAFTDCVRRVEAALKETEDKMQEASQYLDQKCEELKAVPTGPIAHTKSVLVKMKPRVSKMSAEHSKLKQKVAAARKTQTERVEA